MMASTDTGVTMTSGAQVVPSDTIAAAPAPGPSGDASAAPRPGSAPLNRRRTPTATR